MNAGPHASTASTAQGRRIWVFHPFLFGAFFILAFYAANRKYFGLHVLAVPLAVVLTFIFLVWGLLSLLLRNARKAGGIVSLFTVVFFIHGYTYEAMGGVRFDFIGRTWGPNGILLPVWGMILLSGTLFFVRTRRTLALLTRLLNLLGTGFVAASLATILSFEVQRGLAGARAEVHGSADAKEVGAVEAGTLPDIFYILLDGYGREDVLSDIYGYDNSPFLDFLVSKGFFIAREARANYSQTGLSQASTFNMMYLQEVTSGFAQSYDREPTARMIGENAVCRILEEHGYTTVVFPSGYYVTDRLKRHVTSSSGRELGEFNGALLGRARRWMPFAFAQVIGITQNSEYARHRRRILHALEHLPDARDLGSPVFVYAHIVCPHPPFVFTREGKAITPPYAYTMADGVAPEAHVPYDKSDYVEGYVSQLEFLNIKLRDTIERILSSSDRPVVILLQADHGPGATLDFYREVSEGMSLRERMAILSAYYFYDQDYRALYDEVTPVNSFRILLNQYFGADYGRLPDESYMSVWLRPYDFQKVDENYHLAPAR